MRERRLFNIVRYVLEDLLPPAIRDSRLFYGAMWLVYRDKTKYQTSFRPNLTGLTDADYRAYYQAFPGIDSKTDCNQACIERILLSVVGTTVLDVGCGRGYLANLIQTQCNASTTGVDFLVSDETAQRYPNCEFQSQKIETLEFDDNSFDTVVCTHTLEHILDIHRAVSELRRVARKRLILVVPREREYRYSFNLHVHFFPYMHSFLKHLMPLPTDYLCRVLDGDIFYIEDMPSEESKA